MSDRTASERDPDASMQPALRIACVGGEPAAAADLRGVLAVALPSIEWTAATLEQIVRTSSAPDCVVLIDSSAYPAAAALRELRASGYNGAAIIATDSAATRHTVESSRLGASVIPMDARAAKELPEVLVALMVPPVSTSLRAQLDVSRQLIAAGEIAMHLRHDLNNQLSALLAEAQLLEMEELGEEPASGVRRILELCRRTIAVTRRLEAIAPRRAGGAE